jgi:hypothetical protein
VESERVEEEEAEGHRETDKIYRKQTEGGGKRQRKGEVEAEGHKETDKRYRKQTKWSVETDRRSERG